MLISGGASKLGQATANRLANKGAQIVLTDLPHTNGATIAKEIGENVHFMPADATSEQSVETIVNDISKNYGKLNVLVNCLGLQNGQKDEKNNADVLDFFSDRIQVFSVVGIQFGSRNLLNVHFVVFCFFGRKFLDTFMWSIQYDAINCRIDGSK